MPLTRRHFSACLLGSGAASVLSGRARAQNAPAEGVNYLRLPELDAWAKRAPDDVAFRRVPVWFREEPFGPQQRLFFTLETLGLLPTLHRKVFSTIHGERTRLRTPEDLAAFPLANGVDPVKVMTTYGSFAVQSKAQQARQTAAAYRTDAVPAMGVQGRYYTNGDLANAGLPPGSNERMLAVVDALVAKVRQGSKA